MNKTINISKDFSPAPAGRYKEHGRFTGEVFREDFLLPALLDSTNNSVEIILDGLEGVGASFWDEAFGEMIRTKEIPLSVLQEKLTLICHDDPTLVPTINSVIDEAKGEIR